MIKDIIKGMKLGIKPFIYVNAILGVVPVYYLWSINILLALHVLFIYVNFFLMGLLIVKYLEAKNKIWGFE